MKPSHCIKAYELYNIPSSEHMAADVTEQAAYSNRYVCLPLFSYSMHNSCQHTTGTGTYVSYGIT